LTTQQTTQNSHLPAGGPHGQATLAGTAAILTHQSQKPPVTLLVPVQTTISTQLLTAGLYRT